MTEEMESCAIYCRRVRMQGELISKDETREHGNSYVARTRNSVSEVNVNVDGRSLETTSTMYIRSYQSSGSSNDDDNSSRFKTSVWTETITVLSVGNSVACPRRTSGQLFLAAAAAAAVAVNRPSDNVNEIERLIL